MKEFIEKLEEVLERDEKAIKPQDKFREFDEWSSIAVLTVLAFINDEYDVTIPRIDFENLHTVQELYNYINK